MISFRGTEPFDADDWITDFEYYWYEIPNLGKVHMGFLEALGLGNRENVTTFHELFVKNAKSTNSENVDVTIAHPQQQPPERSTAYHTVRRKLKSLLTEHENARFVVTGHSLGGALAILFPTMLVIHEETDVMKRLSGVYTYGQPRIGNRQLGKFMEAHLEHPVPKYFRVVYNNDLVPRLPYDDKTFLYKHFGVCMYYNCLYVEQVNITQCPFFICFIFLFPNIVVILLLYRFIECTRRTKQELFWTTIRVTSISECCLGVYQKLYYGLHIWI